MDPITGELLRNGLLGVIVLALITGFLVPKWVLDEYRKREAAKDEWIERQAEFIEKLAAKASAAGHKPGHDDA